MERIDLEEKLALVAEPWSPRIVAELNGQHVKLAKLAGDFVWHRHEAEDELFLVVSGRLRMDFRDREVWLGAGQMIVVPRGVEHKPFAPDECSVLLFEPAGTLNTGDADDPRCVDRPERI
jgi:mannose-6-phosphate isomerase-like protein (cupin superfamily)